MQITGCDTSTWSDCLRYVAWPTDCPVRSSADPCTPASDWHPMYPKQTDFHCKQSEGKCQACTVAAVNAAYHNGHVRGTDSPGGVLELFNHAYNHNGWPEKYVNSTWQLEDMQRSMQSLHEAYPQASIRTFVPPRNMANERTTDVMHQTGLKIMSSMGTMICGSECNQLSAACPLYNYDFVPCQDEDRGPQQSCETADGRGWPDGPYPCCVPPDDQYVRPSGFQMLPGTEQIFSTPTACANSDLADVVQGWEVNKTLGAGMNCSENPNSIVASAS
eukprot:SAG31_NODE_11921_length_986_cov_0.641488_1_plen_274_part_10